MFGFKSRSKDAETKSAEDTSQVFVAPGTEISYKATLIEKYRHDHQNLQTLFNEVLKAVQLAESKTFLLRLRDLQIALRKHLLDEELNLYIYLRHCYAHEKLKQELINKFKRRSKKVGLEIFGFIAKLSSEGYSISYDEAFIAELLAMGNMLEQLLEAEETHLYPIYKRPMTSG